MFKLQSSSKDKESPSILQKSFSFKNRSNHFRVMRLVRQNKLSFAAVKLTSYFLFQSTISHRSDLSSEATQVVVTRQMLDQNPSRV